MKKHSFAWAIAAILLATPLTIFAQLTKVWEDQRHFAHSDAGQLIEIYYDANSATHYLYTAALIDDYSAMNITKRSEHGPRIWSKNVTISAHNYWAPMELLVDADGNAIIAGEVYNAQKFRNEVFVSKISSSGLTLWTKLFFDSDNYFLFSGLEESDGAVYLSTWYIEYSPLGEITSSIETFKLDASNGEEVWVAETEFEGVYAASNEMVHDASGIYVTGYISNANNGYDILLLKYDEGGILQWENVYQSNEQFAYGIGWDVAVNNDGRIVVAGQTDYQTLVALGYSTDGVLDFEYVSDFGDNAYVYGVQIEDNENSATYVASQVTKGANYSLYLNQLSDAGILQWEKFFSSDYLTALEIADDGQSAWVLGSSYNSAAFNYFPMIHGVDESGTPLQAFLFKIYPGYNSLKDFVTPNGTTFFLEGNVPKGSFQTDELTARWEESSERLTSGITAERLVYPNPCSEYAIIYPGSSDNVVSVYNTSGMLMAEYTDVADGFQMDTEHWTAGVYMIKISDDAGQRMMKLIKE